MKFIKRIFSRKSAKVQMEYPCKNCKHRIIRNEFVSTEEAMEDLKKYPLPDWIIDRIKGNNQR